jgi:hypothetical protein
MHVAEKDDQLIVQTRLRTLLFKLAFSLLFALVGLAVFWFFGRSAGIACSRLEAHEVRCEIKETLLGLAVQRAEVVNPKSATVDVNEDSDGDTYRVVLQTERSTVPLTTVYSSDGPLDQTAREINEFLANTSTKTLNVSQSVSPRIYLIPLCFTGFGLSMMLALSFETYIFDRDRNVLSVRRESLRGTRVTEEPFSSVKIYVRDHSASDSTSFQVHARIRSERELTLGHFSNQRSAQQLVQRIEDFIKPGVRIRYIEVDD